MPELVQITGPRDGVATLTLNRPQKKNALSIALRDEVSDALDSMSADEGIKVIVITGAGPVFCAGFDLKEFELLNSPAGAERLWSSSDRFHRTVLECRVPTIAAVNGPALAGGFDLAVLCDLRIAARSASFAHPEFLFGDVVYGPLRDLVGGAVARELCLTGRAVTAEEALALHLVSAVVDDDALAPETERWAGLVARAPRQNLLNTKRKIIQRADIRPQRTLDL